jgi:hypothetical protein
MATYTNRNPASDPENAQLFEEKGWQDDPVSDLFSLRKFSLRVASNWRESACFCAGSTSA